MSITISPGHWKIGTGASDIIDEVTEARKVVNKVVSILRANGITTNKIEDNTSANQRQNLNYIVSQHNKTNRKLDVSVHFNASGGRHSNGIGTEVLYYAEKSLADSMSKAIADASGLKNRGAKQRKELAFLSGTNKPSILLEICFVNSHEDVKKYHENFEYICFSIAKQLSSYIGEKVSDKIVEPKEEIQRMFKPSSVTLEKEMAQFLEKARKSGAFSSTKWEELAKKEALTLDDAIGLVAAYLFRTIK